MSWSPACSPVPLVPHRVRLTVQLRLASKAPREILRRITSLLLHNHRAKHRPGSTDHIVIHDDQLGALGTFPGPLAVGATITISNLRTNWAATTTIQRQSARSVVGFNGDGSPVSASTNAVVNVLPASIACQKLVSLNGGAAGAEPYQRLLKRHQRITWYVVVTNTGLATLCNIVVRELGTGPDLLPCGAVQYRPDQLPGTRPGYGAHSSVSFCLRVCGDQHRKTRSVWRVRWHRLATCAPSI